MKDQVHCLRFSLIDEASVVIEVPLLSSKIWIFTTMNFMHLSDLEKQLFFI
jgi:hypothetical protein